MLVTRQCDTGRNTWSSSKLEAIFTHSASPRMSNFESLSTQPDWPGQYSPFTLPGENALLQQSFEPSSSSNVSDSTLAQPPGSARPPLEHRHSLGPLRQEPQSPLKIERPDSAPPGDCRDKVNDIPRDDSLVSTESTALSLGSVDSNLFSSASSAPPQQGTLVNDEGGDTQIEFKEEEDDDDDDDDMLDAEEMGESGVPQTAAERRAERRKMKRFRYRSVSCTSLKVFN